jgi:predicted PurR-regulated permease PerM
MLCAFVTDLPRTPDLTRTTLAVLCIGVLIAANFWILNPFLPALVWASTIAVATWPILLALERRLGGRRGPAVAVMSLLLLLVFVVPFALGVVTIVDNSERILSWMTGLAATGVPPPPDWLSRIPFVGARAAARWQSFADAGPEALVARVTPYAGALVGWFAGQAGNVGRLLLEFLLTVVVAAILYANGEAAAGAVRRLARRLAGQQGDDAAVLAARAIRGVALGVVVTALAQSVLAGLGLVVAGVPAVGLLTALIFMLCIAQLGPVLVLLPVVVWLYWSDQSLRGTLLLVWTIVVGTMDNFVRPVLIRKGADLPLLLIFAGVIGGLIAFGVIGLFIGPVVLAVTYTLLGDWVNRDSA